jgi:hypothetical protein
MLHLNRWGLFGSDMTVKDESDNTVGRIIFGLLPRSPGEVTIGRKTYTVHMNAGWRPSYVMKANAVVVAEATQRNVFYSTMNFEYAGARYALKARSLWLTNNELILVTEDSEVGSICGSPLWTARLPPSWPMRITFFVIWLALVQWDQGGG